MHNFTPRPFQTDAVRAFSNLIQLYAEAILVMPPGGGKTKTFLHWVVDHAPPACFPIWILIHEADLLAQWMIDAAEVFGYGEFCGIVGPELVREDLRRHIGLKPTAKVILCMDQRVKGQMAKADAWGLAPATVCLDELHLLLPREGTREIRSWGYRNKGSQFVFCGLTGTPINHDDRYLQPSHVIGRDRWVTPVSPNELTAAGYWAPQEYLLLPKAYQDKAELYFKEGAQFEKPSRYRLTDDDSAPATDEYIPVMSTAGKAVMKALFEDQLELILQLERRANEAFMVFCADVPHAEEMAKRLSIEWGETVPIVHAKTKAKERKRILEGVKTGDLRGVCLVGCWLSGIDIPNAKTAIFCSPCGSRPRFLQMATRVIRPGRELCQGLSARFLDLALNFARHGALSEARFDDESTFDQDTGFKDRFSRICLNPLCNMLHDGFPKPRKPGYEPRVAKSGKRTFLKANVKTGYYEDGSLIGDEDPLLCDCCDSPVTLSPDLLSHYLDWEHGGQDPKNQPPSMGFRIGSNDPNFPVVATYGKLKAMGFYGAPPSSVATKKRPAPSLVDRSVEWQIKRESWGKLYKRERQAGLLRSKIGPSVTRSGVLEFSSDKVKASMVKNLENLLKGTAILVTQSFLSGDSPLEALKSTIMYPQSDFVYSTNGSGSSLVVKSLEDVPNGFKPTKASRELGLKTIYLQGVQRALDRLLSDAPNPLGLLDSFSGWVTESLEQVESEAEMLQSMNDHGGYATCVDRAEMLESVLDLVRLLSDDYHNF